MAKKGFELRGVGRMRQRLREIAARVPQQAAQRLRVEAEQIRTRSLQEYVPKNIGTLANSIRVHDVEFKGGDMEVKVTAGDASAPYALVIHEFPDGPVPPTWQGKAIEDIKSVRERTPWSLAEGQRGPKYLERPLNLAIPGMAERIAKAIVL